MDPEVRAKYLKAGAIAGAAREYGRTLIKEGASVLEVAEAVEAFVEKEGGKPAFPVNLSFNTDAAHYSPRVNDDLVFKHGDLVKLDVGVHVDGYIGDNAVTVEVGTDTHRELREAATAALRAAIKVVRDGAAIRDLGAAIEHEIRSRGFQPVANLTGHSVDHYHQHAGLTIPNIAAMGHGSLKAGQVIAIEPFATTGAGRIKDSGGGHIYHYRNNRPQRTPDAKAALKYIQEHHSELPFSERWLTKAIPASKVAFAMRMLEQTGAVSQYAILREIQNGMVAQAENTVIVTETGCEITTLPAL
ncbi:MAG TPA: type II methionyl aminopeptidase [Candidatus Thermoplasmatota archaeon]|nr:type II methionyl aminopeptidase [Candidatus Thermoplasmatota archaeon]